VIHVYHMLTKKIFGSSLTAWNQPFKNRLLVLYPGIPNPTVLIQIIMVIVVLFIYLASLTTNIPVSFDDSPCRYISWKSD